jgi:hypothetical protein
MGGCALAMAAISPGIVYSFASMSTGKPSSRRVAEVTGPMEAKRGRGRPRHTFLPNRARKFLAVEELVNVIT